MPSDFGSADAGPPTRSAKGWRGRRVDPKKIVRHRWQRDWTSQHAQRPLLQSHKQRLKLGALLCVGGGLIVYYLWLLLFAPVQTPFIAIASSLYEWPLPPNAWAREDLDGYLHLDGETLRVIDVGAASRSREQILRALDEQLRHFAHHGTPSETVIISLSMHGAVNGRNEPCLIPPGASPLNADTWIPVSEILDLVGSQKFPRTLNTLLVLDCTRMRTNWNIGLLCNTFAERLQQTVERRVGQSPALANLAVLNSTSPGETSRWSPELGNSAFGYYLQRGLAGAADDSREGGNADRHVSLRELHRYLNRRVDAWAQHNRGARQQPMLLPSDAGDFHVVWALREGNRPGTAESVLPEITAEELAALWSEREAIGRLGCVRLDPLAWRNLEHRLQWLEQLATAGPHYAGLARRTCDELKTAMAGIRQRASDGGRPVDVRWDVFLRKPMQVPTDLVVPSLPLARKFGTLAPQDLAPLAGMVAQAADAAEPQMLSAFAHEITIRSQDVETSETHFLALLGRFQTVHPLPEPAVRRILQLRQRAEAVAAPRDARVLPWIRPLVDTGDRHRRIAEDRLFSETASSNDATPEPIAEEGEVLVPAADFDFFCQQAEQSYAAAEKLSRNVSAGFAFRDRVASELPYLAAWTLEFVSCPREAGYVTDLDEAEMENALLELIAALHRLSSALAQAESDEAALAGPLSIARQNYELLRGIYDSACTAALEIDRASGTSCRDIQALLAVPLLPRASGDRIPVAQRTALRALARRMSTELQRDGPIGRPQDRNRKSTAPTTEPMLEASSLEHVLERWREHPALAILVPQSPDSEPSDEPPAATPNAGRSGDIPALCARKGQQVRHALLQLPLIAVRGARTSPSDTPAASELAASATQVRMSAAFAFPAPDDDPVEHFREQNLQTLLLWHCRRVLDDFYGPRAPSEAPFFDRMATRMLRSIEPWLSPESPLRRDLEELRQRHAYRRRAATGALQVRADSLLLVPQADQASARIGVQPADEAAAAALPAGEATVYLADASGMLGPTSHRLPLPLPGRRGAEFTYRYDSDSLRGRGPQARAVAWFRGHEFATDLMMSITGGVIIATTPQSFDTARVTLDGERRKGASIVFILDCSASMREAMSVEGVSQGVPRLSVARNALIRLLQEVGRQKEMRAGVMFYGHRVGWTTEANPRRRVQTEYAKPVPDDLQPYEDVEVVLPLGRFDLAEAAAVASVLETVVPWGETPLYLSLTEALRQFEGDNPDAERSIVVITDGVNYQRNAPIDQSPGRSQVVDEARRRNARIHIVGFGIPADQSREAQTSFRAIADETGGSYNTAETATDLIATLLSHLGPARYVLRDAEGRSAEAEIGSGLTLDRSFARPQQYTVAVDGVEMEIELGGGEDLRLLLTGEGDRIDVEPYRRGVPRTGRLISESSGGDAGLFVAAHPPLRSDRSATFELSLAREDRGFLARPTEVWVEITPVLPEGEPPAESYLFYDRQFLPGTSTPVLTFRAEDWPPSAATARVECWCKWSASDPVLRLPLGTVLRSSAAGLERSHVPGVPGVRVMRRIEHGERLAVHIVELHDADSPGLFAMKVDVDGLPRPEEIVRRYDRAHGVVAHTFFFGPEAAERLTTGDVVVTTRQSCHRDSRRLKAPLLVDVSSAGDVIVLPAGPRLP